MGGKRYVLSASAIILDDQGRTLLLRRSADAKSYPDQWEPPGGKVQAGEELGQALCRETREETGLEVELVSLVGCSEFELRRLWIVVLYLNARAVAGKLQLSREHSASRWVGPAELPRLLLTPPFRRLMDSGDVRVSRAMSPPP
jgi:8-oxo-dGTP diphosphatase